MNHVAAAVVSLMILVAVFSGLPLQAAAGSADRLTAAEPGWGFPPPFHPNDILRKPKGLPERAWAGTNSAHTVNVYYAVPADVVKDWDVQAAIESSAHDLQAWYQTASGGWTWEFANSPAVVLYEAEQTSAYYRNHDDWWGSLLPEMQGKGLPIWAPGIVTVVWAHGAGWWAGANQGCQGECGVALLGVELFPQFNDPLVSGGSCPDPDGQGGEAWPCTPVGAFAHELGHTVGLIHPADDPQTAPYAAHSLMQTHWNYPDEAPGEEQPWGFLRTERQQLRESPFMKKGIRSRQVYQDRETAVNLPPSGDPPYTTFDSSTAGGRLSTINHSAEDLDTFWTFGDYQTSHEYSPVHWYQETGGYEVILRTTNANGMMGSYRALVDVSSLDPYEPNDSLAEAFLLLFGESAEAAIDNHDDVPFYEDIDFFRFFGYKGESVAIKADADYPGSNLWPMLCLFDDTGTELACHSGDNYGELFYDLEKSGFYYLRIDAICGEGGAGCQGPYLLTLGADYEHEPNNTIEEATAIACGEMIEATLNGYDGVMFWEDKDYYRFNCDTPGLTSVTVQAALYPDADLLPLLCLYDDSGTNIVCGDYGSLISRLDYAISAGEDYILRVGASCGVGGIECRGPYTLQMTHMPEQTDIYLPVILQ